MRTLLATVLFLGGCQCLSNPTASAPVVPFVPGAPQLPPMTAAAPPVFVQVPSVNIVPGSVSLGGGVPTLEPPPMVPIPDPPPTPRHGGKRPRRPIPPTTALPPPPPPPEEGLTAAAIRGVLAGASGRVQRCYEPRLANDPNLRGRVTIALMVAADGSVSTADVRDSFDPEIGGCVASVMRSLRFPATPAGGNAVVPFNFSPPAPPPGDAAGTAAPAGTANPGVL